MIDYEKYDVIKDADEEKSYLCNSLNAEVGTIHRIIWYMKNKDIPVFPINLKDLERWADYIERSQNVITYLRKEQEAKTVINIEKRFNDCDLTGYCPFCSYPLIKDWAENYCGYCGKPVLWKGR